MGHSLGGYMALRICARRPQRVRRMVLEATPVPPTSHEDAAAMRAQQTQPWWWRAVKLLGGGRMLRLALRRQFDFRSARPILRELRAPMAAWWESLRRIDSPCLVLASNNDGLVAVRAPLLAGALRDSTLVRLGSGHRLHAEHCDAFLREAIPFLMQTSAARNEVAA